MKSTKIAAFIAAAGLLLAGCSGGGDDSSSGNEGSDAKPEASSGETITIWTDSQREAAIKVEAEKFEADTGTKVEVVQKNFEDLRTDFIQQVPTGEGPDITIGAHDWLGAFVIAGVVNTVDLSDRASEFEDVAIEAFTYDGQLYAVPYSIESVALIQNTDLVGEEAPATWDEMIEKGEASGAERPFVISTSGETGDGYTMYGFQTSFDAPVFVQNEDGSYTSEVGMGGEKGEAFAQWLSEQSKAGYISTTIDYDINNELFQSGKAAYTVQGPWVIPLYEDINVAVNPIPSAGGSEANPFVGVQGFYISAQSDNALLANDFVVNYLGSADGQRSLYEADPRLPALTEVANEVSEDPIVGGFLAASQNGVPMPNIPEMGEVWDFWNAAESQIINGSDAVSTWNEMVANLESALAK